MKGSLMLLIAAGALAAVLMVARTQGDLFKGDPDKALLDAVKADNLTRFETLLKEGADPNRIFGKGPEDWVMCQVTDKGRLDYLKLALAHGGDMNLRNPHATRSTVKAIFSSPLLCAIRQHNDKAFAYLLEQGVDTEIKACTECKNERLRGSPITVAEHGNEYKMVYDLIQHRDGKLTDSEVSGLITGIERTTINEESEANAWRLRVTEWLRAEGHAVEPWTSTDECRRVNCRDR